MCCYRGVCVVVLSLEGHPFDLGGLGIHNLEALG
jgi:hypothetical protein